MMRNNSSGKSASEAQAISSDIRWGYQTPFEIIEFRDEVQNFWSYLDGVCTDLYAQ
jgi:hypothetical protein